MCGCMYICPHRNTHSELILGYTGCVYKLYICSMCICVYVCTCASIYMLYMCVCGIQMHMKGNGASRGGGRERGPVAWREECLLFRRPPSPKPLMAPRKQAPIVRNINPTIDAALRPRQFYDPIFPI